MSVSVTIAIQMMQMYISSQADFDNKISFRNNTSHMTTFLSIPLYVDTNTFLNHIQMSTLLKRIMLACTCYGAWLASGSFWLLDVPLQQQSSTSTQLSYCAYIVWYKWLATLSCASIVWYKRLATLSCKSIVWYNRLATLFCESIGWYNRLATLYCTYNILHRNYPVSHRQGSNFSDVSPRCDGPNWTHGWLKEKRRLDVSLTLLEGALFSPQYHATEDLLWLEKRNGQMSVSVPSCIVGRVEDGMVAIIACVGWASKRRTHEGQISRGLVIALP